MQHKPTRRTAIAAAIPHVPPKPMAAPISFDDLPGSAFVKQPQILQVVPISASSLWRWVKIGAFPKPLKLSDHCSVWKVADVRAWMAAQTAEA